MIKPTWFSLAILLCLSLSTAGSHAADSRTDRQGFDHPLFKLRLSPRTPQQIAGFYEGRGFPRWAIDELGNTCFITVGLHNKSDGIIWFDLGNWQFMAGGMAVQRQDRNYWLEFWRQKNLPVNLRTTFRWTLMPEQLDFRPHEAEGGNIILPRTDLPITINAQFRTGADKQGAIIKVQFDNVHCARDPAP
jgi:hypothetical protein